MTRDQGTHYTAIAVIAGLTRNLPNKKESSPSMGDGGCSSAMTSRVSVCISKVKFQQTNCQ